MTDENSHGPLPQCYPAPRPRRPAAGTIIALVLIGAGIGAAFVISHKRQVSSEYVQDPDAAPGSSGSAAAEPDPRTAADLPILGTVVDFELTERSGKPVNLASLKGRVWIAENFFTYCGGPCPAMNRNLQKLHFEFTGKDEPKFVSITADPVTDTLEALVEHARTYQADTDRWWFLTGDELQIKALINSMTLVYKMGDRSAHSTRFVLIDREGHVRGTYVGTIGPQINLLRRDLRLLLAEPKKT